MKMLALLSNPRHINKCATILSRAISTTHLKAHSYDNEQKSTVTVLNNESDLGLMINGYSQVGFRLNNDLTVLGPMAIFPRSVLSWNVGTDITQVSEEAFCLFTILEPKLDIIVIGTGDKVENFDLYSKLLPLIRKHHFSLEILPTEQACATFNFLNAEGRYVAGALMPPQTINVSDDDLLRTKLRYQSLYGEE